MGKLLVKPETVTLCDILQQHIDAGTTTRKAIAMAARVSEPTVARWVHGQQVPDWNDLLLLLRRAPDALTSDVLELMKVAQETPPPADLMAEVIAADREGNEVIGVVFKADADGVRTPTERAEIAAEATEAALRFRRIAAMAMGAT